SPLSCRRNNLHSTGACYTLSTRAFATRCAARTISTVADLATLCQLGREHSRWTVLLRLPVAAPRTDLVRQRQALSTLHQVHRDHLAHALTRRQVDDETDCAIHLHTPVGLRSALERLSVVVARTGIQRHLCRELPVAVRQVTRLEVSDDRSAFPQGNPVRCACSLPLIVDHELLHGQPLKLCRGPPVRPHVVDELRWDEPRRG